MNLLVIALCFALLVALIPWRSKRVEHHRTKAAHPQTHIATYVSPSGSYRSVR